MRRTWRTLKQLGIKLGMQRNKEFGLPNKCILKRSYLAQRRSARREKNLSDSATLRDKKYYEREFLMGSYSGKNAAKNPLRSRHALEITMTMATRMPAARAARLYLRFSADHKNPDKGDHGSQGTRAKSSPERIGHCFLRKRQTFPVMDFAPSTRRRTTSRSRRVEVSPRSAVSPLEIFLRSRRMILPLRVLGRASAH